MEYTKGDWWVEVGNTETSIESDYQTICDNVSNCDANLIAAAPQMYEALKDALEDIDRTGYCTVPSVTRMQRALAKVDNPSAL